MLLSCHKNAGQNYDKKIANRSFENVAQFKYMRTVTNQNLVLEEIELWQCLLPFSPEPFVFLSVV
jgi:hypothetical protein